MAKVNFPCLTSIETPTFHYSQIPQPDLNCRGHKASSSQAQTSWIRRQSKMNTKRWANCMFCPSLRNYFPLVQNTNTKTNKKENRSPRKRSKYFLKWVSTDYLLAYTPTFLMSRPWCSKYTLCIQVLEYPLQFFASKTFALWETEPKIFLCRLLVTEAIPNGF